MYFYSRTRIQQIQLNTPTQRLTTNTPTGGVKVSDLDRANRLVRLVLLHAPKKLTCLGSPACAHARDYPQGGRQVGTGSPGETPLSLIWTIKPYFGIIQMRLILIGKQPI